MKKLQELVRENIWHLKPYKCARDEFKGEADTWLDANESSFNAPYNRYPDPLQKMLKARIAPLRNTTPENIFLGVGSDECIDIIYRVFCNTGIDNTVAISPTYGMYEVCADINGVEYRKAFLNMDFTLNEDNIFSKIDYNTKIIWICSPNNPTGNAFKISEIENLCTKFEGIIVIDEAYIDFSKIESCVPLIEKYPNLIVLQTFSKAWASAAIRLGIAFASKEIISIFNKVKYPYNISRLTQVFACKMLDKSDYIKTKITETLAERNNLVIALKSIPFISKIYPTDANFILVNIGDADAAYRFLCKKGIVTRNRNTTDMCKGCIRITVGSAEENKKLINALKEYYYGN